MKYELTDETMELKILFTLEERRRKRNEKFP